jgi:hypothetical protein
VSQILLLETIHYEAEEEEGKHPQRIPNIFYHEQDLSAYRR